MLKLASCLQLLVAATAAAAAAPSAAASAPPRPRPRHAVILLIDDLGYGDTGYMGAEFPTPTIDALASDLPCNVRRDGGVSLVIGGSSLVILQGKACNPL